MQAMQILQQLKSKFGLSAAQVAKETNISQSTIHRIATGETKHCRTDSYLKIKELYDNLNKSTQTKPPKPKS